MYCSYCGKKIPDSAKFCQQCGKPLELPDADISIISEQKEINPIKNKEVVLKTKKSVSWLRFVAFFAVLGIVYFLIFGVDIAHHTDPVAEKFTKKCTWNQNMDFGDFSLYFTEKVEREQQYNLGHSGCTVFPSDNESSLSGMVGVISVTGDYVYLGDITIYSQYSKEYSTTKNFWYDQLDYYAVNMDEDYPDADFVSSLRRNEAADVFWGGDGFVFSGEVGTSEQYSLDRIIISYKDSKGKNHIYYVEP